MATKKVPSETVEDKKVEANPQSSLVLLLQKLHRIMEQSPYLQKDKKNTHDGYNYLSEEKIKEHFQGMFAKERLMFLPVGTQITKSVDTTTSTGKPTHLTEVVFNYQIVDVDTGFFISGSSSGQGEDRADKGVYKAITGALKYALTTTFLLPAGNDPEDDSDVEVPKKATPVPSRQVAPPKQSDPTRGTQPDSNGVSAPPVINRTKFTGRQKALADAMDQFTTIDELKTYYTKELSKEDKVLMYNYAQYLGDKLKNG